jgi:hypothetical protein
MARFHLVAEIELSFSDTAFYELAAVSEEPFRLASFPPAFTGMMRAKARTYGFDLPDHLPVVADMRDGIFRGVLSVAYPE